MTTTTVFTKWKSYAPYLLSVLRIVAAIMFIQFGTVKLFGFPMSMPAGKTAEFPAEVWFAGMLEAVGGAFILIGLCTRPIAFVLAGEMAVAYFQGHASRGFWTIVNGGGPAMMFCFLWLYFSAAGAGPWSFDAMKRK